MARRSYGPQAKERTKRLLEALLTYANGELENDRLPIQLSWKTENQLIVKTKVRYLEELIVLDPYDGKLNSEEIKEALHRLQDFLKILEDNRVTTKGSEDWHFTLKLWYRRQDTAANLQQFDVEWERQRPEKSKQVTGEEFKGTALNQSSQQQANRVDEQNNALQSLSKETATPLQRHTGQQDWGEAPDVASFYGRKTELAQLEQWIVKDHCKVVALLGMGGIGKTSLAVMLADQIQLSFDCLIWRSLKAAPSLQTLLESLIPFLSHGQETLLSQDIQQGISQLIHQLRQRRCLVILDEAEAIFRSSEGKFRPRHAYYQEGYEGYGELLRRLGSERHQSCLLLTSREKPEEIAAFEGQNLPVRSLLLRGLQAEDALDIFRDKGFSGSENGLPELISLYGGNPLALKVITTMILEVFNKNVSAFLSQSTLVIGDRLHTLLKQQVNRLSDLEKEVVYWLTIEREPVSLSRLRADLLFPPTQSQLMEAIAFLERRSLIEKMAEVGETLFTLQPLVMKYVTEEFIEQALDEIDGVVETQDIKQFKILRNHALVKSQSPKSPPSSSADRMLRRFKDSLQREFRSETEELLREILPLLRGKPSLEVGYVGHNLREIFKALEIDSTTAEWQDISMR